MSTRIPKSCEICSGSSRSSLSPYASMRPLRIKKTLSISGMTSERWLVTRTIPIPDWASARIVSRRPCCAKTSRLLLGSSNTSVCGSCTSARAIKMRFAFPDDRIALARNGLDERGLAAAVRAQDRDVLARFDAQAEVIKCDVVASNDAHVFKVHQGRSHEVRFSPRFIIISRHVFPLLESSGGFIGGRAGFFNSGTGGACPLSRRADFPCTGWL